MSNFDDTIDKLKSEIAGHVSQLKANPSWIEIEKLFTALNTIEGLSENPTKTSLAEVFGFSSNGETVSVQAGEFIGMDALEAAKLYMEKKKATASSLDEIIDAIEKGGAQNPTRDALAMSLARSTWDVVKAPRQELYTLAKYAPHVKRGRKKPEKNESDSDSESSAAASASGGK
jgi:hypothetical protein